MKKESISLNVSIGLLVFGILLGSVFVFGMQYWNSDVTRETCTFIETRFVDYTEIRQRSRIKEIAIDCTDGERYFIDGVSINTELRKSLSELTKQDSITLLIHPYSNTILELSHKKDTLLAFENTTNKLNEETKSFLVFGFIMYLCSAIGLCGLVSHFIIKSKTKRKEEQK